MGGGESGSEGSSANLLEASFLLGERQLGRPVRGFWESEGPLNRKSPAWVSRLRLGTGGTDGVRVLGSGTRPGPHAGAAALQARAQSAAPGRLLHQVKYT